MMIHNALFIEAPFLLVTAKLSSCDVVGYRVVELRLQSLKYNWALYRNTSLNSAL